MFDPEPVDDLVRRPQGRSCFALLIMGVVSVFLSIVILATVGAILFPGFGAPAGPDPTDHPAVGQKLSCLDIEPLTGSAGPVTLEDLAGKVVLVNFWGTWCQPCRDEAPHLAELDRKFRPEPDFRLLAVSCGMENPENIDVLRWETERFLENLGLDMPTYADPDGTTQQAFFSLGTEEVFPITVVLDRRGVIRCVWPGFHPEIPQQMEEWIRRLLEEEP